MINKLILLSLLIVLAGSMISCTTSTSVGGATLETGYQIDNDFSIISTSTNFNAGEYFYYSFFNNDDFGSETVTLQLIDSDSNELLFTTDYNVQEDWNIIADEVIFNQPGKYKIAILINGKTRATQEVIIE
jgi:hypothetical protein